MGDTVPDISTVPDIKAGPEESAADVGEGEEAAQQEDVGELACPKCEQIYAGPASLKRHLWRIHRLAGDEAQALVDEATENPLPIEGEEEEEEKPRVKEEEEQEGETSSSEVKPLLAVSLSSATTPKVRPLLSLSPEPPAFQGGGYGGGSSWMMSGGGSMPQTGLLPTPQAGPGLGSACHQTNSPEMTMAPDNDGDSPESESPGGSGKIPSLMSIGVAPTLDQGGIKPLMSIPVDYPPYMSGSMGGMGYYGGRYRRRERRTRPYPNKNNRRNDEECEYGDNENGDHGNMDNSDTGEFVMKEGEDPYEVYQEEGYQDGSYDTGCGDCGLKFDDPASLADHEPCSESVSIDLNCDVEITG